MKRRTAIILNISKILAILGALVLSLQFLIQLNSAKDEAGEVRSRTKLARPEDTSLVYERSISVEKKLGDLEYRFIWTIFIWSVMAFSPWARTHKIEVI